MLYPDPYILCSVRCPRAGRGGALSGGLDAWAAGGGRADQGESPATEGQLRKLEQLGYEG